MDLYGFSENNDTRTGGENFVTMDLHGSSMGSSDQDGQMQVEFPQSRSAESVPIEALTAEVLSMEAVSVGNDEEGGSKNVNEETNVSPSLLVPITSLSVEVAEESREQNPAASSPEGGFASVEEDKKESENSQGEGFALEFVSPLQQNPMREAEHNVESHASSRKPSPNGIKNPNLQAETAAIMRVVRKSVSPAAERARHEELPKEVIQSIRRSLSPNGRAGNMLGGGISLGGVSGSFNGGIGFNPNALDLLQATANANLEKFNNQVFSDSDNNQVTFGNNNLKNLDSSLSPRTVKDILSKTLGDSIILSTHEEKQARDSLKNNLSEKAKEIKEKTNHLNPICPIPMATYGQPHGTLENPNDQYLPKVDTTKMNELQEAAPGLKLISPVAPVDPECLVRRAREQSQKAREEREVERERSKARVAEVVADIRGRISSPVDLGNPIPSGMGSARNNGNATNMNSNNSTDNRTPSMTPTQPIGLTFAGVAPNDPDCLAKFAKSESNKAREERAQVRAESRARVEECVKSISDRMAGRSPTELCNSGTPMQQQQHPGIAAPAGIAPPPIPTPPAFPTIPAAPLSHTNSSGVNNSAVLNSTNAAISANSNLNSASKDAKSSPRPGILKIVRPSLQEAVRKTLPPSLGNSMVEGRFRSPGPADQSLQSHLKEKFAQLCNAGNNQNNANGSSPGAALSYQPPTRGRAMPSGIPYGVAISPNNQNLNLASSPLASSSPTAIPTAPDGSKILASSGISPSRLMAPSSPVRSGSLAISATNSNVTNGNFPPLMPATSLPVAVRSPTLPIPGSRRSPGVKLSNGRSPGLARNASSPGRLSPEQISKKLKICNNMISECIEGVAIETDALGMIESRLQESLRRSPLLQGESQENQQSGAPVAYLMVEGSCSVDESNTFASPLTASPSSPNLHRNRAAKGSSKGKNGNQKGKAGKSSRAYGPGKAVSRRVSSKGTGKADSRMSSARKANGGSDEKGEGKETENKRTASVNSMRSDKPVAAASDKPTKSTEPRRDATPTRFGSPLLNQGGVKINPISTVPPLYFGSERDPSPLRTSLNQVFRSPVQSPSSGLGGIGTISSAPAVAMSLPGAVAVQPPTGIAARSTMSTLAAIPIQSMPIAVEHGYSYSDERRRRQ